MNFVPARNLILHTDAQLRTGSQVIYLFYMARKTDLFYKDKKMALHKYQKYLSTGHKEFKEYTIKRMAQLKEVIHQTRN